MADEADLNAQIARLETALVALGAALDAPKGEDQSVALAAAEAELETARAETKAAQSARIAAEQQVMTLQQEARDREAALSDALGKAGAPEAAPAEDGETIRLRAALDAMTASADEMRAGAPADASLKAEVDALRAARAMDLAEMQAILNELEPMMEAANA